ncbi:ATP-binding protein [Aminipila terrae]|uniref:AAA family ATPase n=1 Tax=Aminipila terrae TaxID=2697030 RepID=A0A6P1MFR4_9FIRM|nr:AAA family ATPase [Aminipila terrae]QHI72581.1 AAA family ATPase [Aminipila terrae]
MEYNSNASYLKDIKHLTLLEVDFYESILHKEELGEKEEKLKNYKKNMEERLQCGDNIVFLPLEYLFERFNLDLFQRYCVRLSLMPELIGGFSCDVDFAVSSFAAIYHRDMFEVKKIELLKYFEVNSILKRVFLTTELYCPKNRLLESLQSSERIKSFVIDGSLFSNALRDKAEIWDSSNYKQNQTGNIAFDPTINEIQLKTLEKAWTEDADIFLLYGLPGSGKKEVIRQFCRRKNLSVIFVKEPSEGEDIKVFISQVNTEAAISQSIVCFEEIRGIEEFNVYLDKICTRCFVISTNENPNYPEQKNCRIFYIQFPRPNITACIKFWNEMKKFYSVDSQIKFESIACKFNLNFGEIKEVMETAEQELRISSADDITEEMLYRICRKRKSFGTTNKKIIKIETHYSWDELVLPEFSKDLLLKVCSHVEHYQKVYEEWGFLDKFAYGTGVSAIFTGAPGTGKTMAAQVVANKLGLDLYKVNLAGVVSKYIGETEKNLQEIFEEASGSQAVLFFDEADVLFSKRTEVKSSNDKYSNMEAAYMLQKIEEHKGICILATNYYQNFDEAFKRRIKFIIDFPFPNSSYRKILWQQVFPQKAPLDKSIDWEFLSDNFELSGSNIKNIALNAAFESAEEGSEINMKNILKSLKNEYDKIGKHISKNDLGQYYLLLENGKDGNVYEMD